MPKIEIKGNNIYKGTLNKKGSMCNTYSPFKNLQDINQTLGDFATEKLNFDLQHPVDIIPQDSYDGSVNLILNDGKNQPRLVNSRFSVIDNGEFKIPDHSGYKDTNIYDINTFDIDTSLKTIANKIPQVEFYEMTQFAGSLPCGAYTFYFKLSDADGNESEVLAESGIIQLFIGGLSGGSANSYVSSDNIRMGLENENTGKSITFKLTNIDSGFDYVHVLYARSSSSNDQASVDTYHKIIFDYPIIDGEAIITITGNEQIIGISAEELYVNYADLESVKTQTVVNNVLFFGNTVKKERDWDALRIASWKIFPGCGQDTNVGTIDHNYNLTGNNGEKNSGGYYNPYNVYYRVGYWPDELYRFGVVYIFNDNSLSPVFNICGADLGLYSPNYSDVFNSEKIQYESEQDDYYFDKSKRLNSRGVVKFPKKSPFKMTQGILKPNPLYITFDLSVIGKEKKDDITTPSEFFEKHEIKGLFFVRQKRIPTILCQGISIGLTNKDLGAIPILRQSGVYKSQSFLGNNQIIQNEGTFRSTNSENVSINGLLVPDSELSESTFNQLFVSNKYSLNDYGSFSFLSESNSNEKAWIFSTAEQNNYFKRKLTNVPEDTKTLTDGEMYFSTLAGNPHEPYKTIDICNVWNETKPQDLTRSNSLIRGNFGSFVGVGEKDNSENSQDLSYGHLYNIKLENYFDNEESATELDFQKRFNSAESYHAISDRMQVDSIQNNKVSCYRGDCFQSLFTHRMFRNFIDPELPTNDKIINPACWAQNYAVRCTAIPDEQANYNVYKENEGWIIPEDKLPPYANEIAQAFEIKENNTGDYHWDVDKQEWYIEDNGNKVYLGKTATIGGTSAVSQFITGDNIRIVKPSEQESGIGGVLKNIFKSSLWAIRGLASINRADVNAVGLGQWITFPICSSKNLALRDIDYSNATEQASFNRKRSFYPFSKMDVHNPLRDSNVINQAASISLPHKQYYAMPNVPFIKQEYFTRIINSLRDSASSITNEFKVMLESAYVDYTKIYGSITKLMPLGSKILVVFEHGIGILAVNESMSQAENALQFLPAELNMVVSQTYGSMWKDSIIESQGYIYGVDTVAKVIWRISGEGKLELISDKKVEKFLIDSIDLSEFSRTPYIGHINVKTHYNAFKHDVLFTYYNDILYQFDANYQGEIDSEGYLLDSNGNRTEIKGTKVTAKYNESTGEVKNYYDIISEGGYFKWAKGKSWSLCFNEQLGIFTTFYDWIPIESENIDNIWFSFDREAVNNLVDNTLKSNIIKASGQIRDDQYSKNLIDSAFNNTCSIVYTPITFEIDGGKLSRTKTNVIGFYVNTDKSNYEISVNNSDSILSIPEGNGWKLVVLKITSGVILGHYTISVSGNNRGMVSDAILKTIDREKTKPIDCKYYDSSNWDDFYYIRDTELGIRLWKHGFAGIYDNERSLQPTHWYGKQHEFNFEFIARKDAIHKVFNNLQIISNKAEPYKFEFEVVGEAYEWHKYKSVLKQIADKVTVATDNPNYQILLDQAFKDVLNSGKYKKLPYLTVTDACIPTLDPQIIGNKKPVNKDHSDNTVDCCLVYDKQLNEFRVHTEQLGNDMWKYGRLRGNMQYLEDLWRVEIRPVSFKWVYLDSDAHLDGHVEGINFSRIQETRHRDKYIKIKVRYSGEDLAVIQAINTLFDYSYA